MLEAHERLAHSHRIRRKKDELMRHAGQPGRNTQELRKPFIRASGMASPSGEKNCQLALRVCSLSSCE